MSESVDLDEVHGLVTRLCEEQTRFTDESLLLVMEAFNDLSELHVPAHVCPPTIERMLDPLGRSLDLLDRLVSGSHRLQQTLALMRIRRLLGQVRELQR